MTPEDFEQPARRNALAFTILVHTGLIAALILGVQWKRSPSDLVEVELWSNRPAQAVAMPPPPPPPPEVKPEPIPEAKPLPKAEPKPEPPPPQKPDIAIKEEKKPPKPEPEPKKPEPPKPEPKKPEPPKPEPKKPEPPKPEVKPEPKAAPDFSEMLKREAAERSPRPNASQQMAKAAAAEADQRAAAGRKGLQDYAAKIRGKVRGNIMLPPNIQGNPEAIFDVNQLPGGEVLEIRLRKSSGNPSLDAAIERAIRKSSPLPPPDDPAHFRRDLEIKYRPIEE